MTTSVRFGALLIPNVPWSEVVARARRVEALGFDTVWIDDHLVNPQRPAQPWFESWIALAGLAGATSRIRLGPLVANTVLRHPALLARQALTVDHQSGGRLEIGLGSGYAETDHRFVDQPLWPPRERSDRFREAVALVDRLLRGAPPQEPGRHFSDDDLELAPRPVQSPRPPIIVAAHGPSALDVAARYGDGWSSFGGWSLSSDELLRLTRARNAELDERCAAYGRAPASVRRLLLAGSAAVTPDPLWSSVGAFEDFVGRYRDAGIDEFVFYYPPETVSPTVTEGVLEAVAADVLPRLRAG